MSPFSERLARRVLDRKSPLCVGIDPHLDRLAVQWNCGAPDLASPPVRQEMAERVAAWARGVLEAVEPYAAAVKPQVAFFEALGAPGVRALEDVVQAASELEIPVVLDAKRGDIGSTAEAYARGTLDDDGPMGADSITLSPYLGPESMGPFLRRCEQGKGLFVLVRTSNPGAGSWQVDGPQPIAPAVAAWVHEQSSSRRDAWGFGPVGAVVAATVPEEAAMWRRAMPHAWLLVPGFGAQGGGPGDVENLFAPSGLGALVNSSRGVLFGNEADSDIRVGVAARADEAARVLGEVAGLR